MRILHLYKDSFPVLGGIENYVRILAGHQKAAGHKVEILVTNTAFRGERSELDGVPVTKAGRLVNVASAPISLSFAAELYKRLYSKSPPDILHFHAPYPISEAYWLIARLLPSFGRKRPKVVLTYHSDIVRQKKLLLLYAPLLRQVLSRTDVIIATSPNYIASSSFLNRPKIKAKCVVVPLGIDPARFSQPNPDHVQAIRQQYTGPLVLFAGRLRYYKGVQYLLDAMPQVDPAARLLIIGIGPMYQQLQEQTSRLNLHERVTFLGEIPDAELPDYYAACDLFVLPSGERSEAYGIVQMEAMAAGRPVVATELGTGTSYVNLNEQTGLIVPAQNSPALATAINRLLADPALCQQLGEAGRTRVRENFTIEKMVAGVEDVYQGLN